MKTTREGMVFVDLTGEPDDVDMTFKVKHSVFKRPCELTVTSFSFRFKRNFRAKYVMAWGTVEYPDRPNKTPYGGSKQIKFTRLPKRVRDYLWREYNLIECESQEAWEAL